MSCTRLSNYAMKICTNIPRTIPGRMVIFSMKGFLHGFTGVPAKDLRLLVKDRNILKYFNRPFFHRENQYLPTSKTLRVVEAFVRKIQGKPSTEHHSVVSPWCRPPVGILRRQNRTSPKHDGVGRGVGFISVSSRCYSFSKIWRDKGARCVTSSICHHIPKVSIV